MFDIEIKRGKVFNIPFRTKYQYVNTNNYQLQKFDVVKSGFRGLTFTVDNQCY